MRKEIFGNQQWYHDRPEPEEMFSGVLEPANPPLGPGGRTSPLTLRTADRELPIYIEGVERVLQSFSGRVITVRGKLVDFQRPGFFPELWIGVIEDEGGDR